MQQNSEKKESSALLAILPVFREMSKTEVLRPVAEVHAESKERMKDFVRELQSNEAETRPKPL